MINKSCIQTDEECFVSSQLDEQDSEEASQKTLQLNLKIRESLPANELRSVRRPQSMSPRTMFLDQPFYLLKDGLNEPCEEQQMESKTGKCRLRINNKENYSIQQFFMRPDFTCLYNKLSGYKKGSCQFTGKIRGVSSLTDYNWKEFKQLEMQIDIPEETTESQFDSDFECGNLCRVYVTPQRPKECYLLLQNDVNSHGYNNWFFFRYRNVSAGSVQFNIMNMVKRTSSYRQGMKISMFSMNAYRKHKRGWFKGGNKITNGETNFIRQNHHSQPYYFLSFEHEFEEQDQIYFAMTQPYTYTRLINQIESLKEEEEPRNENVCMEVQQLAYTLSNNILPLVKFCSKSHKQKWEKSEKSQKPVILILGRQHPSETVGSFIGEALMKLLMQGSTQANTLLQTYDIYMIPMINADGVIHGNSRCNLAGFDLNRQWGNNLIKELTPETFRLKNFITNLHKTQKIQYMIDLHGHGKKLNSFFFGCKWEGKQSYRMLSMLMKKLEPRFNIYGCTYGVTKDKQATIRSQLFALGINHVYTHESSLYGWNDADTIRHYREADYKSIASSLVKSLFALDSKPALVQECLGINRESLLLEISLLAQRLDQEELNTKNDREALSDSDPEGDNLNLQERLEYIQDNDILRKKLKSKLEIKKKVPKNNKIMKTAHRNKNVEENLRGSCPESWKRKYSEGESLTQTVNQKTTKVSLKQKKMSYIKKWKQQSHPKPRKKVERHQIAERSEERLDQGHLSPLLKKEPQPIKIFSPLDELLQKMSNNTKTRQTFNMYTCDYPMRPNLPSKQPPRNVISRKSKTETKERELEDKIQMVEIEERGAKYTELRDESLKILLKETFSNIKNKDAPNEVERPIHSQEEKYAGNKSMQHVRNRSQRDKSKLNTEECAKLRKASNSKRLQTEHLQQQSPTKKLKESKYYRFEKFLRKNVGSINSTKIQNSVFYHFPLL